MYKLRNILKRTAVPLDPEKRMKAAEDFMLHLLQAYVFVAAHQLLLFSLIANQSLAYLAKSITFLLLPTTETATEERVDGVNLYARELLTLALLWHEFHDACKEGDGD